MLSTNLVVKGDAFLKLVDIFFHMLFRRLETRVFFSLLVFCKGGGFNGTIVENLSTIFFGMIKLVVFVILLFS